MAEPLDPAKNADRLARGLARPDRCYTEVSRSGEAQPCDKPAVAARLGDSEDEWPYPVCGYHARTTGMVPLSELYASRAERDRLRTERDRLAAELAAACQQVARVETLCEQWDRIGLGLGLPWGRSVRAALAGEGTANRCTGLSASWCPVHGDCRCPRGPVDGDFEHMSDPACPLHNPASTHGEGTADQPEGPFHSLTRNHDGVGWRCSGCDWLIADYPEHLAQMFWSDGHTNAEGRA